MADFEKQFVKEYRLTTAEIFYHLPDYPKLLQTYIWQDYDLAPKFPVLLDFLDFWKRDLEGELHSVVCAGQEIITPGDVKFYQAEISLQ